MKSPVGVQVDTHGQANGHSYRAIITITTKDPFEESVPMLFRITDY
ncbi:MAG: hypothetical protein WCP36_10350 [Methanomicrobiales archaeon]